MSKDELKEELLANMREGYALGGRDMLASILATTMTKVKLPDLAELYKKSYGEEHFSHTWHTNANA